MKHHICKFDVYIAYCIALFSLASIIVYNALYLSYLFIYSL